MKSMTAVITKQRIMTVTMVNQVSAFQMRPLAYLPMMCLSAAMITIKTSRIGSRIPLMTWAAIIMPKRLMPGIRTTNAEMTRTVVIMPW